MTGSRCLAGLACLIWKHGAGCSIAASRDSETELALDFPKAPVLLISVLGNTCYHGFGDWHYACCSSRSVISTQMAKTCLSWHTSSTCQRSDNFVLFAFIVQQGSFLLKIRDALLLTKNMCRHSPLCCTP